MSSTKDVENVQKSKGNTEESPIAEEEVQTLGSGLPKERIDLKAEVKKSYNKKKIVWLVVILIILVSASVGLTLGLLLKPNDDRYVINVPGQVSHIVTDWTKCANFTLTDKNGSQIEYRCTVKTVESQKVNLPAGNKNSSSIYQMRKKENGGEFQEDSSVETKNASRLLAFLPGRMLGESNNNADYSPCDIKEEKCRDALNSIPVMYIDYDDNTNKIINVSFPIKLTDEQRLELLDQGSLYHPELNRSLINRPEDQEKKTVEDRRGNETFSGVLTEKQKDSKTEIDYNLKDSSNSSQSPVSKEQKTVIDNENKRIVESSMKAERSLSQNGLSGEEKNGGRLLQEVQENKMILTSSVEVKSRVVSTEKNSEFANFLEKLRALQDLETYSLEEINEIAERYNRNQNKITNPEVASPSDALIVGEQGNSSASNPGNKRMLLQLLSSNTFAIFSFSIFGIPILGQSTVNIYEGDSDSSDYVQQSIDLLLNGKPFFRPTLFQGYLPMTLKSASFNTNLLSIYNNQLSVAKSLTATIINFCFSVNSVSLCGKVNLVMNYGITYKAQHYPNSRFEGSISSYFNADLQGAAYADLTVLRAGIELTGSLVRCTVPVSTNLQYSPRKASLSISRVYGAYTFSLLGWFKVTQAQCNISKVCLVLWNTGFCVTNPCNVVDKSKTYSFLAAGSSGTAQQYSVVSKSLQ